MRPASRPRLIESAAVGEAAYRARLTGEDADGLKSVLGLRVQFWRSAR